MNRSTGSNGTTTYWRSGGGTDEGLSCRAWSAVTRVAVGVGLVVGFVVAAPASLAHTTTSGDSVVGQGAAGAVTFAVDAHSGPTGANATGTITTMLLIGEVTGTVALLCVSGNPAVVVGPITAGPFAGSAFVLHVQDGGQPPTGTDLLRLEIVSRVPTTCPAFAMISPAAVTEGDVVVTDDTVTFARLCELTRKFAASSPDLGESLCAQLRAAETPRPRPERCEPTRMRYRRRSARPSPPTGPPRWLSRPTACNRIRRSGPAPRHCAGPLTYDHRYLAATKTCVQPSLAGAMRTVDLSAHVAGEAASPKQVTVTPHAFTPGAIGQSCKVWDRQRWYAVPSVIIMARSRGDVIRTQIQLTEEQDRQLEALAASSHRPKAKLVRQAVDLLLTQNALQRSPSELRKRALDAIGRFRSGQTDVAVNHDRYLADIYGRVGVE